MTPADETASDWFTEARFGMFIHFGLYSLAARHEWVMQLERMSVADYERYAEVFDPDLFDPRDWMELAVRAGAKYVVLTTKHHDGFCLWDSALSDYTATKTPFGRDLVAEVLDAAREAGLRVGLYHSLIDWHHPDFTIDGLHPRRGEPRELLERENEGRDFNRYRAYLHGQVEELLTRYGRIDYLFFDYSYDAGDHDVVWGGKGPADWHATELLALARRRQPGILVNDRLGIPADFVTPEQYQPTAPMRVAGQPVAWEACQTLNGSWGYDRDNHDLKDSDTLVRMLIESVANNGNMLLNIGPNGRGQVDPDSRSVIEGVGSWMSLHERAIRGCGPSDLTAPLDARYTQRGNRLYLHLFAWPAGGVVHLPDLAARVRYAQLLHDGSEVTYRVIDPDVRAMNTGMGGQPPGTLTLTLPVVRPSVAVPVVELFLTD